MPPVSEEELVTRVYSEMIFAKPMIDAVRYIKKKIPLVSMGADEFSPSDKLFLQLCRSSVFQNGTGYLTRLPEDVAEFIDHVYNIPRSSYEEDSADPT